jgi:PKD repeat protein
MASHTYAQPGTYSIALSVTDDDGGTGTSTLEVEVVQGSDTVVLKLLDSSGNGLSGGTANYYDGGWQDIPGRTDADGTLVTDIPATRRYRFRMRYARAWVDKTQDVSADPTVVFQTTNVTTELRDSNGNLFDTGTVRYYAPGWRSFGTTTGGEVSKELLPRHYRFRMHYAGAWVDKTQDVGADPTVVFQTGQVHSVSGTATHYHARRWRPFTNDMQLLPKIYRFRYADRSRKKFAISAGTTTNID